MASSTTQRARGLNRASKRLHLAVIFCFFIVHTFIADSCDVQFGYNLNHVSFESVNFKPEVLRVSAMSIALPFSAIQLASCSGLPQSHERGVNRIRGVARRARYGGRPVLMARMSKGETDVKLVLENGEGLGFKKEAKNTMEEKEEPFLLQNAVAFVTELLRVFSSFGSSQPAIAVEDASPSAAMENQNVVDILREDYKRAYFLTGDFTTSLYDVDCLFADPTIQFRGRDKYQRNLKLLVPFFEEPRLALFDIEESLKEEENERFIKASWNLRTYLKLPWKPLIDVNGSTLYVIDANSKIVKHIESWSVSSRQAVQQIFVPSDRAFQGRKT